MKNVIRCLPVLCISLFMMIGLGCGKDAANQNGANHNNAARVEVKVEPARLGEIRTTIHVTGTLKAAQETKLGTKVPGRVEKVNVDEGGAPAALTQPRVCVQMPWRLLDVIAYRLGIRS
ncbi:hypothetical protein J7M28_04845 [bacterium]|nr:hypothetical protein [bacterium]